LNIVVRKDGDIIAEHDFAEERPVLLWSASKTFTAMAVGIAQSEGLLSINDLLLSYFTPTGSVSDNLKNLRIRDLLCMGSGHRNCPITKAMEKGQALDNVEALFFEEEFADAPGTRFKYDNSATYMLSKLITRCSGLSLRDYLVPRLFSPLGIETPYWESDPGGVSIGCSGLHLNAHDLSKFGQLLLDQGEWNGKTLIPKTYVEEATKPQISTANFNEPFATADYRSGYGYQLWMNRFAGTYRIDGLYGQYSIVIPQKRAVVTYISNEPEKMTAIIELTWNTLMDKL
jgi:CubicO group peptidase (beta-lactamase class C family)